MTNLDLPDTSGSTLFPGLQEVVGSPITVSGTISPIAVPGSGSVADGSLNIPMPRNDLLPLTRLQLTGLTAETSNYWFPHLVATMIIDGNFGIYIISKNDTGGRKLVFNIQNNTAGALTFGGCGINVYAHLYTYPWA